MSVEETDRHRFEAMASELDQLRSRVEELEGRARQRRRRRPLHRATPESADAATPAQPNGPAAVSRRRLFGLVGGAAAAGAGLAVAGSLAGSAPADAATVDVVLGNGTGGTGNDAGTAATSVISTATSATLQALNTANPQLSLTGATTTGPLSGSHSAGDVFVASDGVIWYATSTGDPANWVPLSLPPIFAPITPVPVRVFDSRVGEPPSQGPKGTLLPGNTYTIDISNSPAVDFTGAYAALLNLSLVPASSGGFLAIFPNGTTWGGTANILWDHNSELIGNNATTTFDGTNKITAITSNPTDLIIDLFGLYLG